MVHERQRLTLSPETGDNLRGVHPRFDDFQGNLAMNGSGRLVVEKECACSQESACRNWD